MTSYCIISPLGSNYSRLPGKMFTKIKQGKGNELLSLDKSSDRQRYCSSRWEKKMKKVGCEKRFDVRSTGQRRSKVLNVSWTWVFHMFACVCTQAKKVEYTISKDIKCVG